MKHKVSIIVPAYNCGNYIEQTINCLLNQTYSPVEIIIVNDGSTDDTVEKIASLKSPSIIVISQNNKGVSAARNAGINRATGKYIMFMDADDEVEPDWVLCSVRAIETYDSDIAAIGYRVFDRNTRLENSKSSFSNKKLCQLEFIERIFRHRDILPAIWNKIFCLDIIKEHNLRFDSNYAIGEDLLFLIQYSVYIRSAYIAEERNYHYFINSQSAMNLHRTSQQFKESWLSEWYSIKMAEKCLFENGISINSINIKKVRIADKIISIISRYSYETPLKNELLRFLRKNAINTIMSKEFGIKKKLSIVMNCISPGIKKLLKD